MKTLDSNHSAIGEQFVRVGTSIDLLGESPVWSVPQQSLYWVDVRAAGVRRLSITDCSTSSWPLEGLAPGVALTSGRSLLLCRRSELMLFDPSTGGMLNLGLDAGLPERMRLNEMKCDRSGRTWVGSMRDDVRVSEGDLLRLDGNGFTAVLPGVTIPNTLTWSPNGETMYFSDGKDPVIWSYDYDNSDGAPSRRREFTVLAQGLGFPDGATVDSEGYLWCTNYGGWSVSRYDPSGGLDRHLELPVSQPTSCAFGGPDLDILFVTSAAQKLSDEQRQQQPLAGALFAVRPGVSGLPDPVSSAVPTTGSRP